MLSDRRAFLKGITLSASALSLGWSLGRVVAAEAVKPNLIGPTLFGPWLSIGEDGSLALVNPETEYGQGTATANAILLADELDADWSTIRIVPSDASRVYANPGSHRLSTDGSWGMRGRYTQMRLIGATARAMLVSAAAAQWSVDAAELTTQSGQVLHSASGRSARYGELALAAAKLPIPTDVPLKASAQWRLIGTAVPRLDIRDKCTGRAKYAVDLRLPGLLHAAFARCPVLGGTVKSVDDSDARARAGVRQVLSVGYGVAVLADDPWTARTAAQMLRVEWDEGPNAALSSESLARDYAAALDQRPPTKAKGVGDVAAAESAAGARIIDAEYTLPYLTHQCMEPTGATAWVHDDVCEVWTPTASMGNVVEGIGYVLGLPEDKVQVHRAENVGGSFGLRGRVDPELEAAQLSKLAGAPVQVVRRREEDVQHGWYRPYEKARMRAVLDASGQLVSWRHRVAVQSINGHIFDELIPFGVDIDKVNAKIRDASAFYRMPVDFYATSGTTATTSYKIPNLLIEGIDMEVPVPVTHWRSVGYSGNTFVTESFMDELAHQAGQNPIAFRQALLVDKPRYGAVLTALAAEMGQKALMKPRRGHGWGIAGGDGFECFCAAAVELQVKGKALEIKHIICVYDQGVTVNLDQSEAQVQGGLIDGLSAALYGEITLLNGRVQQSNFLDYPLLRLSQVPAIQIKRIDSQEKPGSITEMITPTVIPALTNALYAATGERVRELPLKKHGYTL